MTTRAVNPFVLKDALFQVDVDNYEAHVSQVQFDPATSIQTWGGLTPTSTHSDVSTATWTATIALAQDWETAESLSQYLHDNEGETKTVVFKPRSGSGPSFTATITIVPGTIGGTGGVYATATITVPSTKPVKSTALTTDTAWAIAVTGSPTGGTYTLTFNGFETAPLAYNAATSAVTAAINALSGVTGISGVTVSGTASSYTLTFPEAVTMVPDHALTGGSSPTVTATGA